MVPTWFATTVLTICTAWIHPAPTPNNAGGVLHPISAAVSPSWAENSNPTISPPTATRVAVQSTPGSAAYQSPPTEGDCDGDGIPDEQELAGNDCNSNGTPDNCELFGNDCNVNAIPDACDIAGGTSADCDTNGQPDACELARLVGVSIPVGSMDASCYPAGDGVWSVAAAPGADLNLTSGIGYLVNPAPPIALSLHDHQYVADYVPDPARAVVTYEFSIPVVVDQIEVVQHANGITRIEGFVGDSLGALSPVGSIFGPAGDVTGSGLFPEGQPYVFDFDNTQPGRFFRFVIRKTSLVNGYASYQIFPRNHLGQRYDGQARECNDNGVPDACEPDCNANGVPDNCDVLVGLSLDCNTNGVPDACDLAWMTSVDCNFNGTPDECDILQGWNDNVTAVFVTDRGDDRIHIYSRGRLGLLTLAADLPVEGEPSDVVITPNGRFCYVAIGSTGHVRAYRASAVSPLMVEPVAGQPFAVGNGPAFLATDPKGRYLYVSTSSNIEIYKIHPVTGILTLQSVTATNSYDIAFHPSGRLAIVAAGSPNAVFVYRVNPLDGNLSFLGAHPAGDVPFRVCLKATNNIAYVLNYVSNDISILTLDIVSGTLTEIMGSPAQAGFAPSDFALHPDGGALYVLDQAVHTVDRYRVGAATGELLYDFSHVVGSGIRLAIDAGGANLYVCRESLPAALVRFAIDGMTGALFDEMAYQMSSPASIAFSGISRDCNTNALLDECEIASGATEDCNTNGVPDECDCLAEPSLDCNHNRELDLCEHLPARLYVRAAATGAHTGLTWADAFPQLSNALCLAAANPEVQEIWVAAGIYRPDESATNPGGNGLRQASFRLREGLALYGGFAGTETELAQRNVDSNASILSGDLAGNDMPGFFSYDENSYHVVTAAAGGPGAVLDGFVIEGGNADGLNIENHVGGGLRVESGSVTVARCRFRANRALPQVGGGGGAIIVESLGSAALTSCIFNDNEATFGGSVFVRNAASATFTDCAFIEGSASNGGGAFVDAGSGPVSFDDCTFSRNGANIGGGCSLYRSASLSRCTFEYNVAGDLGGGVANSAAGTISHCRFFWNQAAQGGGVGNGGGSPILENCLFGGNRATNPNPSFGGGGMISGPPGTPTLRNCTFYANGADWGGGAVLISSSEATLTNCIVWGNVAPNGRQIENWYSSVHVAYSDVEGGQAEIGQHGSAVTDWGDGNIDGNPLFVDGVGPDNTTGTEDDNLRLRGVSPCIDAGDPAFVLPPGETDLDGNARVVGGRVDMGAYEYFVDCNSNGMNDLADIDGATSLDCNYNRTPDECETFAGPLATLLAARSRKTHGGAIGAADIAINLAGRVQNGNVTSEPRSDGIVELRLTFDVPPGVPGGVPIFIHEQACPGGTQSDYQLSIGASTSSATVEGSELVLTFSPALPNARTYRITLSGEVTRAPCQLFEVRALEGDVNSDGLVNATDRSIVVGVWTGSGYSVTTDIDLSGRTNATDRSIVVGAWTGAQNCAP